MLETQRPSACRQPYAASPTRTTTTTTTCSTQDHHLPPPTHLLQVRAVLGAADRCLAGQLLKHQPAAIVHVGGGGGREDILSASASASAQGATSLSSPAAACSCSGCSGGCRLSGSRGGCQLRVHLGGGCQVSELWVLRGKMRRRDRGGSKAQSGGVGQTEIKWEDQAGHGFRRCPTSIRSLAPHILGSTLT